MFSCDPKVGDERVSINSSNNPTQHESDLVEENIHNSSVKRHIRVLCRIRKLFENKEKHMQMKVNKPLRIPVNPQWINIPINE